MAASVHEAILDAAEAILAGLALTDPGGQPLGIYRRMSLADAAEGGNIGWPALLVSPDGILLNLGATTLEEEWGYPLSIRFIASLPVTEPAYTGWLLATRQRVRDAFQRKPAALTATGVRDAYSYLFQGSAVVESEGMAYHLLSSRLRFQVGVYEVRP